MNILDEKIRSELADRTDSGQTPRHTLFFFDRGNFEGLAAVATKAGYKVRHPQIVTASRSRPRLQSTSKASHPTRNKCRRGRMRSDCEYDGWECKLVKQ
jgi:hypothetical protein